MTVVQGKVQPVNCLGVMEPVGWKVGGRVHVDPKPRHTNDP